MCVQRVLVEQNQQAAGHTACPCGGYVISLQQDLMKPDKSFICVCAWLLPVLFHSSPLEVYIII